MVHIALHFDETALTSMREAAQLIAAGSPFQPSDKHLSVSLIGSLHGYAKEEIHQCAHALLSPSATVTGRFVRWGIESNHLRAFIDIEGAADLQRKLQESLPRGRLWRALYVELGSVAPIEPSLHKSFLQAVESSFPIDSSSTFAMRAVLITPDSHPKAAGQKAQPTASRHQAQPVKEAQPPGGIDGIIRAAAKSRNSSRSRQRKPRSRTKQPSKGQLGARKQSPQLSNAPKMVDVAMTSVPKLVIRKQALKGSRKH